MPSKIKNNWMATYRRKDNSIMNSIKDIIATIRCMAEDHGYSDGYDDDLNNEYVESGAFERDMIQEMFEGFSDAPSLDDIRGMIRTIDDYIYTWEHHND